MRITFFVILLGFFSATSGYGEEVSIYAERSAGRDGAYATKYGRAGDWLVACTEKRNGAAVGTRWCSLKPASGKLFSDSQYAWALEGVSIELWRHPDTPGAAGQDAVIDFTPISRIEPGVAYVVHCGGQKIIGLAPGDGVRRKAYGGPQAHAAISAMRLAKQCQLNVLSETDESLGLSVAGFEDAFAYAAAYTDFDYNRAD